MTKYEITFERESGTTESAEVSDEEYILDSAENDGIELPFSCREGNCTSCVGKVLEGEVKRGGVALDLAEEDDGYVLLCSSYPRSDCRIAADKQQELFDS